MSLDLCIALIIMMIFFLLIRESLSVSTGTQIHEHEETVQISPSTVRKTTVYEYHRTLGAGQPLLSATSTGVRVHSPMQTETNKEESSDDALVEEKYEVTLSAIQSSDEGG